MSDVDAVTSGPLSAADIAEYSRRLERAREVMRENGLDGLVVGSGPPQLVTSTNEIGAHGRMAQPRYHRYFSGFHIWGTETVAPPPVVVLLPLDGDPSLIIRPGTLRTWITLARVNSWIENIVSTYRDDDPEWEERTNWGLSANDLAGDVARAIRDSGLGEARIGLVGSWPGMEETRALLPDAKFTPTWKFEEGRPPADVLAPLLATSSAWEIARMERAQANANAGMRAFMAAAAPGVTMDRAVAEARYQTLLGGSEDTIVEMTFSTDPWSMWIAPNQPLGATYKTGDLITATMTVAYDGYWVQMPRTWILGGPNDRQQELFDVGRASYDAMVDRIELGVTGGELYEAGLAVIREAGFFVRGRLGHTLGFAGATGPERFSFMPGNEERLQNGMVFVVHPCVWDKASGDVVQFGDMFAFEDGRLRYLTDDRVSYDTSFD